MSRTSYNNSRRISSKCALERIRLSVKDYPRGVILGNLKFQKICCGEGGGDKNET